MGGRELPGKRAAHGLTLEGYAIGVAGTADVVPVAEIVVQIFDSADEMASESPLDAAADRPAVIFGSYARRCCFALLEIEICHGKSAGGVQEPVANSVANAHACVCSPGDVICIGRSDTNGPGNGNWWW